MASRILHLAAAEEIMKQVSIHDRNRFRLGSILPDAYKPDGISADSHLKISVCGNSKKTYDLDWFISLFGDTMKKDELYLGYYLHLIEDLVFRELVYDKYKWNPAIPGNVERLHRDYHLTNRYAIQKYGITNDVQMVRDEMVEKLYSLYPFATESFLDDMKNDFCDTCEGEHFFFTNAMADEFVVCAADACIKELESLSQGMHYIDAYERAWLQRPVSLLRTTQNTRDLGGYRTQNGTLTKDDALLRSDAAYFPSEEDIEYLRTREITTIIDLRTQKDTERKPSGFADRPNFTYYHFPISEGSGVPASTQEVPKSYMDIASAQAMPDVFRCIAHAPAGVLFHCTAGKDRTGVLSAILLCHAGVSDKDIIENYVLTREYGKERLEAVHRNFPALDMNIVTPCETYMKEFLRMFRGKYGNTEMYFREIGLDKNEMQRIQEKLRGR